MHAAMRVSRLLSFVFLVLFFAAPTWLCAQPAAPARLIELDIPYQPASYGTAFFEETARQFEALRPNVRVRLSGDVRVNDKVRIRVMAGEFPDAADALLIYDTLIGAKKILDLAPYLDGPNWEGDGRWGDAFLPGALDRWRRGENVYALPFAHAVWVVFYNEKLFAQHGWRKPRTWDEFFALSESIRAAGVAPLALPGVYLRYADAFLQAGLFNLAGAEGYRGWQELAPGAYDNPHLVRAAGVLQRISTQTLIQGWEGMTHTAAQQAFLDGRSAMVLSASWFVSEMRGKIPADFSLGAFNLPVFADGAGPRDAVLARSAYYFCFATGDPERERATVDFFRYLTSRERARAFAQQLDAPVALRAVGPDDYRNPAMRQIAALTQNASATYDAAPPQTAAFQAFFNQGLNDARFNLLTGRITPQEFATRLERVAAGERARAQEPDRVDVKHPKKTIGFLAALVGVTLALAWRARRRLPSSRAATTETEAASATASLTRLRPRMAAGFLGPSLLIFGLFVLLPGLTSFVWSFMRWDGFSERAWAGFFNFKWLLLESDTFWLALRNNLYLMIVPTLVVVPLALFFAALIHRGVWGAGVFRAVFLFPNLLGGIAAALLWLNAYDPHGGLVNTALVKLGALLGSDWLTSFAGYAWLSQANLYHALIPIYLWMACGFNLVLYLAAMEGINPELYEAAELDGASAWRQFFGITLPLIWDVLAISAVFIVIAGLNTFEMVWLLTSQEPVSSAHVLSTLMVSTMFREFQVGRATAVAVVMFILVLAGSAVVLRVMRSREEEPS